MATLDVDVLEERRSHRQPPTTGEGRATVDTDAVRNWHSNCETALVVPIMSHYVCR